jgi:hypothetical protein
VSSGCKAAVIQFTRPDDGPPQGALTGRAAVVCKEMASRSPIPVFRLIERGLVPVWAFGLTAGLT